MRRREMDRFRKLLSAKSDELLGRVKAARSEERESSSADAPDLGDRALTSISRDLSYQLSASEREILRRIDGALNRIEKGTYGRCSNCDKPVQKARLEAVPWAVLCIECQELSDRGEI